MARSRLQIGNPAPSVGDPLDAALVARFLSVEFAMDDHLEERAAELGLSVQQAHALLNLSRPAPMRDLADALRVDASYITTITDRLEERGLVERRPADGDRRVRLLTLTAAGLELRGELRRRIMDGIPLTRGLSCRDKRDLLGLLEKLAAANESGTIK